ncbi:class I mannose-6-phosphate isomerase [Nakamurella sp. A5-74]|uniref:Phosphohexomutase n=1 Tax=Nakamurella sp. A5-74 TaxID=3158264 RepID=A0AAU8DSJ8_9ACTN
MIPIVLPPNVIEHFYRGGSRLAQLRGFEPDSAFLPEEWLAATVHREGHPNSGQSRLFDGSLFSDLVAADPLGWLGNSEGGPAGKTDTGILVKLLDADQRLPVHVHPDRPFAAHHLHHCYGKTEAWYVLAADAPESAVWLGFSEDVDPAELATAVDAQDSDWMLARLNRIDVTPGDGILVPAGTAHAIGAGVFVVEVQEPTDFSIVLEWSVTTAGRDESHLGLGLPLALQVVNHRATTPAMLRDLVTRPDDDPDTTSRPLLPTDADPFFRMEEISTHGGTVGAAAGFSVLVVLDGAGTLSSPEGSLDVTRGQVLAVPAAFGDWSVSGAVRIVRVRAGLETPTAVTS